MKWLLYILSCYILLLSCIPCNDYQPANSSMAAQLTTSHDHETQPDYCSPLCVCSCCNVQATPGVAVTVYFMAQRIIIDYPLLPVNPLPSLSDNIWQPPQLV
ncbi:hypothetical protein SAMN05660461_4630 [Chitinophaga ginsengisegetis]|uniref:Uncharacterized protein n=1 Tax=Chitinophaga ginsengisegetis TaxID=393003 RepID=A0A1T5P868_9BACT|nr:DUF6660 family protein [Chitinophaga ginsengisegetis]SKD08753.1 hypothetical protein SAMN05660461_4630 [Chitinophaga ginsengisegetis]